MDKLYEKALESFHHSYSPYSHFAVGASILLKDGTIVGGTNIENASYGLSNCAERSALFAVYSLGYKKDDILSMMVLANTPKPVSPCGACRQVMHELLPERADIILTNLKRDMKIVKANELLPYAFTDSDL
ncbi:MAG: cytidine deaminase [Bacilli bacterium]|nr:cytidine deaminase [Bacilli bacterium]